MRSCPKLLHRALLPFVSQRTFPHIAYSLHVCPNGFINGACILTTFFSFASFRKLKVHFVWCFRTTWHCTMVVSCDCSRVCIWYVMAIHIIIQNATQLLLKTSCWEFSGIYEGNEEGRRRSRKNTSFYFLFLYHQHHHQCSYCPHDSFIFLLWVRFSQRRIF